VRSAHEHAGRVGEEAVHMTPVRNVGQSVQGEPAIAAGAVMAIVNLLVVFDLWNLSADQLSAVNTAVAAVLAYLVRRAVTPTVKQTDDAAQAVDAGTSRQSGRQVVS
jgi:hypothetical protein